MLAKVVALYAKLGSSRLCSLCSTHIHGACYTCLECYQVCACELVHVSSIVCVSVSFAAKLRLNRKSMYGKDTQEKWKFHKAETILSNC